MMVITIITLAAKADGDLKTEPISNYTNLFYNEISLNLYYPEQAKAQGIEGFVIVSFTIASDGSVQILEMNSNDPVFYNSALQILSEIQLCSHAAGKIYHMKFNYNLF
jgi:TonB family protein